MREEVKSVIIFVKCLYVCEALCITVFDKEIFILFELGSDEYGWVRLRSCRMLTFDQK